MTARADSSIAIGGGVGADSVGARRARRDHRPGTCARNLYSKLPEREREPRRAASRRWRTPSDGSRSAKAARSARGRPTPAITPSARRSRSLSAPGHSAVRRALRRLECPTAHSSLPASHDRSTARAVTSLPWSSRPRLSDSGRPRVGIQLLTHGPFGQRAQARWTTCRTRAPKSLARGRLPLRRLEPEAAGASRGRFVAVPRGPGRQHGARTGPSLPTGAIAPVRRLPLRDEAAAAGGTTPTRIWAGGVGGEVARYA